MKRSLFVLLLVGGLSVSAITVDVLAAVGAIAAVVGIVFELWPIVWEHHR